LGAQNAFMTLAETARRTFIVTLVVASVLVAVLTIWALREVVALLFVAFILAAAMRPGIEALNRHRVPRGAGLALHYVAILLLVLLLLWLVVPPAIHQVDAAVNEQAIGKVASESTGLKHDVLAGIQRRLNNLPQAGELVHRGIGVTRRAVEGLVAALFVFATAAYWIFERDSAVDLVASLVPSEKRKTLRDTWQLIDLRLGAYVRGQLLLITIVATVLSTAFFLIGLPYWLLVGVFAGIVELIPVVGPLAAGATAVGVGLTQSVGLAVAAGIVVFVMRMAQDYVIVPRVLGSAVGISPLVVLVSALSVQLLFGGFAVVLGVPLAAVIVTLVDVIVRERDPAEEEAPTVLFTAGNE